MNRTLDTRKRLIRDAGERKHVALFKDDIRILASRVLNHRAREIDSVDVCPAILQVSCDLTGSTAQIANEASPAGLFDQPLQHLAVERLAPRLVPER